jgi:hypothetical protein
VKATGRVVLLALLFSVRTAHGVEARVASGRDRAWLQPPAGARVTDYENEGYRLVVSPDGSAVVDVIVAPLGSSVRFDQPGAPSRGPVETLARAVVAGAHDRYTAASRLLAWVAENVDYRLDRNEDQGPEAVLARRTAFCTGYARLAVALLEAVGIEAREVAGYIVEASAEGPPPGFHRWIEVFFPGHGWVFSDPMASHHFVPATYLRLSDDRLDARPGDGRLLQHEDSLADIDLLGESGRGGHTVRVRPNGESRRAAALALRLAPPVAGAAVLTGGGRQWALDLPEGNGVFLGLEPGRYELKVEAAGRMAAWKTLTFRNRVLAELEVPVVVGRGEGERRR